MEYLIEFKQFYTDSFRSCVDQRFDKIAVFSPSQDLLLGRNEERLTENKDLN